MYGDELGAHLGLDQAPVVQTRVLEKGLLAATRLTWAHPGLGITTPFPRADMFFLSLQLKDCAGYGLWVEGRRVEVEPSQRGMISLWDLRMDLRASLTRPFDVLTFSIPRSAFDVIAEEEGSGKIDALSIPPGDHVEDPVVPHLGEALLPALSAPEQASRLFLDHAAFALMVHVAHRYGGLKAPAPPRVHKLAVWQERRAKEILMAHTSGNVSLEELARECGLSRAHFARQFKATTGAPAHRWLLARRVERARELLRDPRLRIQDIASQLGFADQSHFTRVFRHSVGSTPAAWRRGAK